MAGSGTLERWLSEWGWGWESGLAWLCCLFQAGWAAEQLHLLGKGALPLGTLVG